MHNIPPSIQYFLMAMVLVLTLQSCYFVTFKNLAFIATITVLRDISISGKIKRFLDTEEVLNKR